VSIKKNILQNNLLPIFLEPEELNLLVVGGKEISVEKLHSLIQSASDVPITIIAENISNEVRKLSSPRAKIIFVEKVFEASDLSGQNLVIATSDDDELNESIKKEALSRNIFVHVSGNPALSDFQLSNVLNRDGVKIAIHANGQSAILAKQINKFLDLRFDRNTIRTDERRWKKIATKLIIGFTLMVIGHIIISYLPLPEFQVIWGNAREYFNYQFLFFILAGFLAQMVDGVLGMGYGVTSATCLITLGINPVSISSSIHASEIFTTGISGYSHYRFGNVNKKLFRHLVIPGVIGAILGAILLVFLGKTAGKWLMPLMSAYAMFLGFKILIRAFQKQPKNKKIKRIGWLAWVGGFLDSFGGGGWGPIVTSTLISKGRSPKYTIGSVNLTEFFITLASAVTFFITVGVGYWNIVLGLLIGGSIAAPFAAKLTGKLPKKTMMIAVGIMVMIWCTRMIIKSVA
jgi:siroheme synthase-like protein